MIPGNCSAQFPLFLFLKFLIHNALREPSSATLRYARENAQSQCIIYTFTTVIRVRKKSRALVWWHYNFVVEKLRSETGYASIAPAAHPGDVTGAESSVTCARGQIANATCFAIRNMPAALKSVPL